MTQSSNTQALDRNNFSPRGLALAAAAWLLVLPSAIFLGAGMLRHLQPPIYQPARLSWAIFEWGKAHVSHMGALVLFLMLPAGAALVGGVALWEMWRADRTFREDARAAVAVLRRQFAGFCLTAVTLLAVGILAMVVSHLIVG